MYDAFFPPVVIKPPVAKKPAGEGACITLQPDSKTAIATQVEVNTVQSLRYSKMLGFFFFLLIFLLMHVLLFVSVQMWRVQM